MPPKPGAPSAPAGMQCVVLLDAADGEPSAGEGGCGGGRGLAPLLLDGVGAAGGRALLPAFCGAPLIEGTLELVRLQGALIDEVGGVHGLRSKRARRRARARGGETQEGGRPAPHAASSSNSSCWLTNSPSPPPPPSFLPPSAARHP